MPARDAKGRFVDGSTNCGTCGRVAVRATGPYLSQIANGRTICTGCGRFQLHCECRR